MDNQTNEVSISRAMGQAIFERARRRVGGIAYYDLKEGGFSSGTVNLLRIGNAIFAVTCEHITRPIRQSGRASISTLDGHIFRDREIEVVAEDAGHDIGILRLNVSEDIAATVDCFSRENIRVITDFASETFAENDFYLFGYPGKYAKTEVGPAGDIKVEFKGMSYFCSPSEHKPSTEDTLVLDYDMQKGAVVISKPEDSLPPAPGISGSFVFAVQHPDSLGQELWTAESAQILAVQRSWDTKSVILCSNIKHLIPLLPT